ncbi:hypothetical protein JX265_008788 [Neoarthrinium moseri]|uniref:ABM domain-containing protein n=1 Tax=Neoarthrinium moseri TaxID=1658444 RepID=A0A9Q0AN77_9PEZI|nr:uncharacterized protein JN550_009506 [Neoarthrinium moseri]KAI1848430.1 hypothetical protein JX266_005736 [Neoarthrinium moseri]KAI1863395.1 hypothetical protein JN550_009506 [Neoarthrinium moseri]KAI1863571.1 hypothetical protein JX265_008788 [Neoarthrinium moseri]
MPAVTEIAALHLKPGTDWTIATEKVTTRILPKAGCLRVRYSQKIEDPEQVVFFIDWEDVSAHQAVMKSEAYGPFLEEMMQLVRADPVVYHVPFEPFPATVLNNEDGKGKTPIAEVLHAYFPADISMVQQQEALIKVQQFIDESKPVAQGFSGETAHGFVLEEVDFKDERCRALVVVLGWESLEAHKAYRETEDFNRTIPLLRGMEGLKGMQVFHVSNHVVTR